MSKLFSQFSLKKLTNTRFLVLIFLVISLFIIDKTNAQVSLTFSKGYLGTQGANSNQAKTIKNLSTIGIARISFGQSYSGTFGGTQGNDLAGIIKIYLAAGATSAQAVNSVITLNGALNWRETTGSTVEVFGFILDAAANASITFSGQTYNIVGGSNSNSSTTLGLKSYASTFTFTDGENRSGNAATSGLLDALNAELANSPQPSTITLTSNSVTEGQNLVFNVALTSAPTAGNPQVLTLSTSGTASAVGDYTTTYTFSNGVTNNGDGTITVPAGVSSFTVTVATIDDIALEVTETLILNIGAKTATGSILDNDSTPTLTTTGTLKTFSTCSGCTVSPQSFSVSGEYLTANITIIAPSGFQVSTSSNSGFNNTVTLTESSGSVTTTTIFVKLTNNAIAANSGVISITSTGATSKTITATANTDNALNFDGVNDYVDLPSSIGTAYNNSAVTIEAWIRSTSSSAIDEIIGWGSTANTNNVAEFRMENGKFQFILNDGVKFYALTTTNNVNSGKWVHVAVVKSGTTVNLYINGQIANTTSGGDVNSSPVLNTAKIGVLGYKNGVSYNLIANSNFPGDIDQLRIWNTAKTSSDILNNMFVQMSGNEAGLVASYDFNQGIASGNNSSITSLNETKSNTNNGTLSGFTLNSTGTNFVDGFIPEITASGNATTVIVSSTLSLTNGLVGGVWSSTNPGIATVNPNTGLVTGVSGGSVTLTYSICNKQVSYGVNVLVPTLTAGTLKPFTSCSGCDISAQSLIISGVNLNSNVNISAPTSFQIATTLNGTYSTTISLTPTSGTLTNTTIFVKLINSGTNAASGILTITSNNAESKTITLTTNTDNSLNFDGVNDNVTIADNNALDLTTNYTIEAWIKPATFTQLGGIVSKYHTAAANGYILRLTATGDFSGISFDEMNTSNGVLTLNKWNHVAAVKNGVTRKLYVNGVEQTLTGTALTTVANTDPVIIGQDFLTNGSRFFNGSIDEVRIWNTARSATEITNNMHVSMLGNEAGLVANYNFDQGIANGTNTATTTLTDITANSLSGTISGVTLTGNTSNFVEGFMPSISAAGNATTLASSSTLTLTNGLNGGVWSSTNAGIASVNANNGLVTGIAGGNVTITYTICNKTVAYNLTVIQAATLTSSSLKTFTSCSGCVITPQSIIVSGANLTAGVTISAPAGFEIATATNGTYTSTISLTPNAGTLTNTNIYVRLINSATAATSGNLTITSTGATSKTITATVNTDNALNLDGTNDKVTIADNNALDLTTNYTIETWIKPTAFNASAGIVSKYHSASSNGYILRLTGTGDFSGVSFDEMNTSNAVLSLNKWYHIAAVNNNGTRKLYINGVEQTLTGTPITTAANTDPLIIGQDYLLAGSRFFKGSIDEVRIWNTARTATEITNNMNVALAGNEAGLVASYNFDQGIANGTNTSITTLNDYTANALVGTISGFALTGNTSNFVDGFMPSITAAGNATEFLLGNTLTLSNILTGGTWSSTNTNIATVNTTTGIVTGVSTGTATITYTICGKTASYTVNVTTITATGTLTNFSSCFGIASAAQSIVVSAVTLTNDLVITAPAGYEVATTAGGTYSTSISLTPISGTVTNTTIFIRLSANGFNGDHGNLVLSSGSATPKLVPIGLASVKLNVAARVTISSDAVGNKICTGTNVNFTASAINGGLTPTYQWKLNGANVGINSSTYSNTNLSNNDVVTVIMTSGITSCVTGTPATSNSITIAVYSVPATPTAITGINALCLGSNATYTISDVTFATSYDWVVSGNITATTSSSTAINILANSGTGSATIKVRAVNFCGASAYTNDYNLTISNTFAPKADFNMSNNEICLGVSANNFTNTSTVNSTTNSPLTKYTWNFGDGSALVNTLNASRNYTASGKYNVVLEIQSQDNCLSSISKQVIVYPVSVAGTAKALDTVICEGTSTTINLFGATGSIQWMSSPTGANTWTKITGATSDVLNTGNLTASTDFKAEVRSGICNVATSNTVSITVKYAPSVSILPPSGVGITDTTFKLAYIINSGNPNAYTVDVFGSNPMPNFIPNINYALRGSPLTIAIPPSAMGNYVFSFVATELPYACYSSGPPLTFTLGVGQGNGGGSSIGLSYTTPNVYTVGNTITALNPTITGGALSAYAISPLLPAGLTIDANTGIITGTPSKIFSTTTFVVTGTNTSSTATATVVITVNAAPPAPPVVQSAKYVFGKPGIPTSLNTFVNPLPTGVVPVWCVVGTQNCATTAPAMPSAIGKYIYQVRSFDTVTRLYSTTFVNDTLIIAPPPPIVVDSTYVLGVATNPSNIGVQVSGLSGATFNYFYLTVKQTGTPALGSTIGTKRYTVSQIVNSVESDTASFNVTLLDPNSIIHLQKIVDTGVMQSNSTYNFQFKLIVTNLTNNAFSNVVLIDNLQNSVPNTSEYSVISNTATGGLKANSSFNGNSDINVTLAASTIAPLAKDTSKFVINLVPNGYSGVLTNIAYVKATTKWGTINMQSSELSISNAASKLPTKYQVRDLVLNIPEGFSPNNDGVHDYFVIIKPLNTTIDLEVFNRWGNVVFSSNNYNNDWNGKGTGNFAGQDLVDGGYYYTLRAVDDKGKAQVFKGFVIIQR